MPHDPILAYHEAGPNRFELSCLRTRNVRDQIIRAELLVERLIGRGDIGQDRDLLVVGGGAAGLSACLAACSRGIDTTVLELLRDPVCAQYGVTTRRLHPSEFDWPHTHWRDPFVGQPGEFALDYSPDSASGLAQSWRNTLDDIFNGAMALPGQLEFYWGVDARTLQYRALGGPQPKVGVYPWPRAQAPAGEREFGACISCIGFSGERTGIPSTAGDDLAGPLFWSRDDLAKADLGLNARGFVTDPRTGSINALVSGAGDGAQQDFLRILTGKFGLELADALGLSHRPHELPNIVQSILAEDVALRSIGAAAPDSPVPRTLRRWHAAHLRVANAIWNDWQRTGQVHQHQSLLKPGINATWLLGDAYLSYSYALNRVLALLVARLHAQATSRKFSGHAHRLALGRIAAEQSPVLLLGAQASAVDPVDPSSHTCGADCYGHPHDVWCYVDSNILQFGPYEVIVPRHGVRQSPLFDWPPVHEQRVTFHRPG